MSLARLLALRLLARPRLRNLPSRGDVIDHENQLVIVVAIQDFDVDARRGHTAGDFAELAGLRLVQTLDQHIAHRQHANSCGFESFTGVRAIFEQKMRNPLTIDHESAATLDADASVAQSFTHLRQRAWTVLKDNCHVLHSSILTFG